MNQHQVILTEEGKGGGEGDRDRDRERQRETETERDRERESKIGDIKADKRGKRMTVTTHNTDKRKHKHTMHYALYKYIPHTNTHTHTYYNAYRHSINVFGNNAHVHV